MNEFEKKIRNKLLMRGFTNEKLINNRGLIGATIDEVILEVVKNIGVTRCFETFKEKEEITLWDWIKQEPKYLGFGIYLYKDKEYTFTELSQIYDSQHQL